jgi:hypothetical protein
MSPERFWALPACRCLAPSRAFPDARAALRYARDAAAAFRVGYAVYRVRAGRPTLLRAIPCPPLSPTRR